MKQRNTLNISGLAFISSPVFYFFISCGPAIRSFSVVPLTITAADSVKVNWSARGKATLITHTDTAINDPDDRRYELREFTLVVQKNGKDKKQVAQVNVLPAESADDIIFSTIRNGDTLIASGEKNVLRWGTYFKIKTAASASARELIVVHGEKTATLAKDGTPSVLFAGISNSGNWEIKSLLTEAEKTDSSTIPARLRIHTIIIYGK